MGMKRIAPLISGLIIYLFAGLIYGWSIFVAPLETEFGWSRTQTSTTFTISMIFFCLGGLASGFILKKKSPRFIMIIAAILLFIGFAGASRIDSLVGLYITYGVFCGSGVGLVYNSNISTVLKWFPDKVGFVSGLLLMCFGCGGMVLGSVASALIADIGWRTTFFILAIGFAAIIIICSIWIKNPGRNTVFPKPKSSDKKKEEPGEDMNIGQMLRRKSFWLEFLWAVILGSAGLAVIGHASVCAQDMGASIAVATLITGIISVCNGLGRIISGLVFDHFGRKVSAIVFNITMAVAVLIMIAATTASSIPLFFAGAVVLGISYGSVPPILSVFTNLFYGAKNYALNYSAMTANLIPASVLGPLVAGAVKTATGSYTGVFILLLILVVLAYGLQLMIKRP